MLFYVGGFAAIWWDVFTANETTPPASNDASAKAQKDQFLLADWRQQIQKKIPQRRLGREEEVSYHLNDVASLCYHYDPLM